MGVVLVPLVPLNPKSVDTLMEQRWNKGGTRKSMRYGNQQGGCGVRESEVEKYLFEKAKGVGAMCIKMKGLRGIPDRKIVFYGWEVWIELKRPGATPRPQQQHRIKQLRERGAEVRLIDSKEQVDELILEWSVAHDLYTAPIPAIRRGPYNTKS